MNVKCHFFTSYLCDATGFLMVLLTNFKSDYQIKNGGLEIVRCNKYGEDEKYIRYHFENNYTQIELYLKIHIYWKIKIHKS